MLPRPESTMPLYKNVKFVYFFLFCSAITIYLTVCVLLYIFRGFCDNIIFHPNTHFLRKIIGKFNGRIKIINNCFFFLNERKTNTEE